MANMANSVIIREQLKTAAEARFAEGLPWEVCAERADISSRHLRRLRNERDEKWLEVVDEVRETLEDEALPASIGCLVRMAARNDVAAAKALLDKWRAARVEVSGPGGGPVEVRNLAHLSDEELDALIAGAEDGDSE